MRKVLVEKPLVDNIVQSFSQVWIGIERKHNTSLIYCKIQLTTKLETLEEEKTKFYNLKDPQRRIPNED